MSEKNNEYNVGETPSTSGSNPSNWNSSTLHNFNENNENQTIPEGWMPIPNLTFIQPGMSLQSVVSNFCNLNVYQASNYYYMGEYFQQYSNRHYCQTDTDTEPHVKHPVNKNGRPSKSKLFLAFATFLLLLCVSRSDAMGNNYEGKHNDEKLLSVRRWQNMSNDNQSSRPGFIFTLMCYNVLSQDLLMDHPYLYNRHDNVSLQWDVRWNNLLNEITKFKPDILCLQEVQNSHISNYFSILETQGYSSLYKKRTGGRVDGCAIYYKTDLLQLVEHASVEYFQPNISILNRDNVALIAKFAPKLHPTREFVIATTHLLYNPRRQDVRLAQMQLLLTEIERISYTAESNYLPVILTGDLNSTPDSAVYEFITKSKLRYGDPRTGKELVPAELRITDNCQHVELLHRRTKNKPLSRVSELSAIELYHSERSNEKRNKTNIDGRLFSTGTLSHNFGFKSVYNQEPGQVKEGTTFQGQWVMVDYIFYSTKKSNVSSEDKLKLLSRYRLPTKGELAGINIPNSMVGSDHLSLLAKFKLEF